MTENNKNRQQINQQNKQQYEFATQPGSIKTQSETQREQEQQQNQQLTQQQNQQAFEFGKELKPNYNKKSTR